VFAAILEATVRNLARAGLRIVVAHGHGPSTRAFITGILGWEARHAVRHRTARPTGEPGGPGGFMTHHGAADETSILMALRPDLVRTDRHPDDPGSLRDHY